MRSTTSVFRFDDHRPRSVSPFDFFFCFAITASEPGTLLAQRAVSRNRVARDRKIDVATRVAQAASVVPLPPGTNAPPPLPSAVLTARTRLDLLLPFVAVLLNFGCTQTLLQPDGGSLDADAASNATRDAELSNAVDSQTDEAGFEDRDSIDALEILEADAALDAASSDSTFPDAGSSDAGAFDTGTVASPPYGCGDFPRSNSMAAGGYRSRVLATSAQLLDGPVSLAFARGAFGDRLIAASANGSTVVSIDPRTGNLTPMVQSSAWPRPVRRLAGMAWDEGRVFDGNIYLADRGDDGVVDGAIFRIDPTGRATIFAESPESGLGDVRGLTFSPGAPYPAGLFVYGDGSFGAGPVQVWTSSRTHTVFSNTLRVKALAADQRSLYGGGLLAGIGQVYRIVRLDATGANTGDVTPFGSLELLFSPGGAFGPWLYGSFPGEVVQISRTSTPTSIAVVEEGDEYWGNYLAFAPDGNVMYIADRENDRILCLDRIQPVCASPAAGLRRVSENSLGERANNYAGAAATRVPLSPDGRWVLIESSADNLVPNDTNGEVDLFLYDRTSLTLERVSVGRGGVQGDLSSRLGDVSADGRFVVFGTVARNLLIGETGGGYRTLLRDRLADTVENVVVDAAGVSRADPGSSVAGPTISDDGRIVAYGYVGNELLPGDSNNVEDIYFYDRQMRRTQRVSVSSAGIGANGRSHSPFLSADGRYVGFASAADNLVPGDTNGQEDIFVYDTVTGTIARVSIGTGGVQLSRPSYEGSISADGRFVVFHTFAAADPLDTNSEVDVYLHDRWTGVTTLESLGPSGALIPEGAETGNVSRDGRFVSFRSRGHLSPPDEDQNTTYDLFVRERPSGRVARLSVDDRGLGFISSAQAPGMSDDGSFVAFVVQGQVYLRRTFFCP
jgi:hypothetical protein